MQAKQESKIVWKFKRRKTIPLVHLNKLAKVGPFEQSSPEDDSKEDTKVRKGLDLKNLNSKKFGSLERYLKKIETMDEQPNFGYLNEINNSSHTSKRTVLINQNHIYNNLVMFSQKSQSSKTTARLTMDPNEEYFALKKLIDQIPDDEESDELLNIHMFNVANSNGSEIAEELSNLETERMSELTTEHWSDVKNWHSQNLGMESKMRQPLYTFNLPTLSLKCPKGDFQNPFKPKLSTKATSANESQELKVSGREVAASMMNITFGKGE
jgi:hypothetical protein